MPVTIPGLASLFLRYLGGLLVLRDAEVKARWDRRTALGLSYINTLFAGHSKFSNPQENYDKSAMLIIFDSGRESRVLEPGSVA